MTEQKTICTTCLRLKQGYCDSEKELTACPSYKQMTNGDRFFRFATDEEIAEIVTMAQEKVMRGIIKAFGMQDCKIIEPGVIEKVKKEWIDWLKQEVPE